MFVVKLFFLVPLLYFANTNGMWIEESDSDWQLNILLAKTVSSIIHEFYAKESPAVCIVRAATTIEAYADQSSIITDVLKFSDSQISFRIDSYDKVFSIKKLRVHNIFFIDNYKAFR